jgi:hypothetical protein
MGVESSMDSSEFRKQIIWESNMTKGEQEKQRILEHLTKKRGEA